ncbi:hypothetical protein Mapa_013018 [Marchantia paleacea]|nr:hypothetical protein Mapa_013018 [Marchantia paleacea]
MFGACNLERYALLRPLLQDSRFKFQYSKVCDHDHENWVSITNQRNTYRDGNEIPRAGLTLNLKMLKACSSPQHRVYGW